LPSLVVKNPNEPDCSLSSADGNESSVAAVARVAPSKAKRDDINATANVILPQTKLPLALLTATDCSDKVTGSLFWRIDSPCFRD
jgi:hypothetical protein